MRLSKKRAILLHREMWDSPAETGEQFKTSFPIWKHNGGKYDINKVQNRCFLCEWAKNHTKGFESYCVICPVDWYEYRRCADDGAVFDVWEWAQTKAERKKYARLIRDVPEK